MNSIGHVQVQGLSNHILAYPLFNIPWNIHKVQVTRLWKETSLYCTSTRHTKSYPRVSFVYSLKYMEFKWQDLYDRKRHCLILIWPKGAKWKFQILTAHLQDMPSHILEYQLSTPENVDVVQVTNFTEKMKRFRTIIWPLGIKWKFGNLIALLQDIPNHILDYHCPFYEM